jgi:aminocarboxymuconate-semialdehyde decarboxylase
MTARLSEMTVNRINCQVMSPIPVAFTYWADPKSALAYAQHINDWLAAAVANSGGRLLGLGTVPLQDATLAIGEMERVVLDLGLSGLEIGTIVAGDELNAEHLRPFFRAAAEMAVPILVHPMARYHGYGMDRCCGARESMAIDMLTDTNVAATALVFGGVMTECPGLRICLSHGGGTFTWAYPRLRYFDMERADDPQAIGAELDARVGSLYVDSLVHDPRHLPLLMERYGAAHIVGGSDYPFMPMTLGHPALILDQAVQDGICTVEEVARMKSENALEFLNRPPQHDWSEARVPSRSEVVS